MLLLQNGMYSSHNFLVSLLLVYLVLKKWLSLMLRQVLMLHLLLILIRNNPKIIYADNSMTQYSVIAVHVLSFCGIYCTTSADMTHIGRGKSGERRGKTIIGSKTCVSRI